MWVLCFSKKMGTIFTQDSLHKLWKPQGGTFFNFLFNMMNLPWPEHFCWKCLIKLRLPKLTGTNNLQIFFTALHESFHKGFLAMIPCHLRHKKGTCVGGIFLFAVFNVILFSVEVTQDLYDSSAGKFQFQMCCTRQRL